MRLYRFLQLCPRRNRGTLGSRGAPPPGGTARLRRPAQCRTRPQGYAWGVKHLEISYEKLEAFFKNKIVFEIVAWEGQILRIRI